MKCHVYDSNGSIIQVADVPEAFIPLQASKPGWFVAVGDANDATQYVLNGVLTDKPPMPAALDKTTVAGDGVEVATLSGIPPFATVFVSGAIDTLIKLDAGGDLEMTFPISGTYKIKCRARHYLDGEYTVDAT